MQQKKYVHNTCMKHQWALFWSSTCTLGLTPRLAPGVVQSSLVLYWVVVQSSPGLLQYCTSTVCTIKHSALAEKRPPGIHRHTVHTIGRVYMGAIMYAQACMVHTYTYQYHSLHKAVYIMLLPRVYITTPSIVLLCVPTTVRCTETLQIHDHLISRLQNCCP